ncbi:MAG: ABC transporter substrate-binding protein [Proteobacteria bacterium]|nr:ABC transporter substrate-binding protein [Pseudomonadota bacterium]
MKKLLTVFLLAIFSASAFAQEAANKNQIKDFINEVGGKIISVAGEKGISEEKKKNKIIAIIDESIDSDWISRFVLGKNYKNLNEENKTKFMALYRDFMINTYGPKFKNYNGRKFEVTEVVEQSGFFVAKAEFLPRDSKVPINVDFRVKQRGGKLVILDFIAEGVSLIETQRSEFNSAIAQKGIDQFLIDLDERVKKLKTQK